MQSIDVEAPGAAAAAAAWWEGLDQAQRAYWWAVSEAVEVWQAWCMFRRYQALTARCNRNP